MKVYERGQVLLIVVLVMTIALTIGLSVATRTITSLRTTAEEESSQRAFSAAEAGIEQSLQNNTDSSGNFTNNNTTYQATVATLAGQEFILNNGASVLKDDAADVWLSTYPNYTGQWTNSITVYWGAAGNVCNTSELVNTMAALEIVLLHGSLASPQLTRFAVDPCTSGRRTANNFTAVSAGSYTIQGRPFAYKYTVAVTSGMIMRIIPIYAPSYLAVKGCDTNGANCKDLPAQGKLVTSVGTSDTTQRKLVGLQEYPKLPVQIFPYLIFSSH